MLRVNPTKLNGPRHLMTPAVVGVQVPSADNHLQNKVKMGLGIR